MISAETSAEKWSLGVSVKKQVEAFIPSTIVGKSFETMLLS